MGIKSSIDLSGTVVNGVTLGEPAVNEVTGEFHWDGGVPEGLFQADGMFKPKGTKLDGTALDIIALETAYDVKYKAPDLKEDRTPVGVFMKGDFIEWGGILYICNKDNLIGLPPHKNWLVVKIKEVK